jgi:hypothetical protein
VTIFFDCPRAELSNEAHLNSAKLADTDWVFATFVALPVGKDIELRQKRWNIIIG